MKTKLSGIMTLFLAFVVQFSFAQDRTITGTVTDETGPLPGVSVVIDGTTTGTETDFDGNYSIETESGAVITYSFMGMTSVSRTVEVENVINVTMVSESNTLDEVVVTALGIKREKKSLGYATQEVDGSAVNTHKDPNFVNSLSGKVAGIEVKNSGTMGGSSNVIIRGASSLTGDNQALFVIDGVPVSNSNTNTGNQTTGRGGYDYGNAASDINPDDIETINVLKGGVATALYGSRAANGVIVITTKKGKAQRGIGVTVNSSLFFNSYNKSTFTEYQKEYGAGYGKFYGSTGDFFDIDMNGDGIDDFVTPSTEDASFGGKFDPSISVYQWDSWYPELDTYLQPRPWEAAKNDPNSFFKTGTVITSSVALTGGNEQGNFRLGYTNLNQEGILPNSEIVRDNLDFGASYNLTEKLTATIKASYIKTKGKGRYGTGYDGLNVMQSFKQWFQVNVDIQDQKAAYFQTRKNISWNATDPTDVSQNPIFFDNPYWVRYENFQNDVRHRVIGNVALNYEINDWLSIYGRVTIDNYTDFQEERINKGSVDVSQYTRFNRSFNENNYDLMINFDKDLTDNLNLRAVIGSNIRRESITSISASTNGGINLPGLYSLANSVNPINAPIEYDGDLGVDGFYANASLGWNNTLFLDASYRMDRFSSLPRDNDSQGYGGVSASFVFSSLLDANWLSLGKLRAGWAKTGNGTSPFRVRNTYILGTPIGGQPTASLPSANNNPNLKPETSDELEIGLEMAFFSNRLGFEASYYDKTSNDLLTPVTISTSTGFSSQWLNAGKIQNKGVEVFLYGSPVKTDNFEWRVDLNWSKNTNEVLALPQGLTNLELTSLQGGVSINATVGEPYGTIRGTDHEYIDGKPVVISDPNSSRQGYYKKAVGKKTLGNYQADWIGGLNNRFTYKKLSLSFLIDMKKGGDIFSLDQWYGQGTGIYKNTAGLNELGNPKRDPISQGGGVLLSGVKEDGSINDIRAPANDFRTPFGWARAVNKQHVYDAGFIKLREVALSYRLDKDTFGKSIVQAMTFTASGRNLWIIDSSVPYADPEAGLSSGNVQGYQSGAYPSTIDYGFSVKIEF